MASNGSNLSCVKWSFSNGLSPENSIDFKCFLNISVFPSQANLIDTDEYEMCNEFATMIELLYRYVKCKLSFTYPDDLVGGVLLKNGSWTGIMRGIYENKIDIPTNYMAYTEDRLKICESIYPVSIGNQITILSSANKKTRALAPFKVFNLNVWIYILLFFIISVILNTTKNRINYWNQKLSFNLMEITVGLTLDHFLALIGKPMISRYSTKGYGSNILIVMWFVSCVFLVQLFISEILSNLANNPIITINSLQQIIDDNSNMIIIIEKTSFIYHTYLKIKYPQLNYEYYKPIDLQTNKLLDPILSDSSVLIEDESIIDEIIINNPGLPLHKSTNNQMLGIGGIFVRKSLDLEIKEKFKQKFSIIFEGGIFRWRARVNQVISRTIAGTWRTKWEQTSHEFRPLFLNDLKLFFKILFFGQIFSLIILILEIQSKTKQLRK